MLVRPALTHDDRLVSYPSYCRTDTAIVRSASDMRERPELAIANLEYVLRSDVVSAYQVF